ncbi:hypothetical protein L6R49_24285 [Myxococcota bacterium]|nr:hypothetical protein [Myxococcota bacterium]
MTPEDRQASTLADWLEAGPGAPPPEELDPEVIEATYALRPSMAPPARVSLDDILAGVTTGPFARHAAPLPDAAPEALPAPANAPDFGGKVAPAPPLHRRQSLWGALGALAAAALVLVTVMPLQDEVTAPPEAVAPASKDAPEPMMDALPTPPLGVAPLGDVSEPEDAEQRAQSAGPMPLTEVTPAPPPPPAAAPPAQPKAAPQSAARRYEDTLSLDGSYGKKQELERQEWSAAEADDLDDYSQNGVVGGAVSGDYATPSVSESLDATTTDAVVAAKESARRDRAPLGSRGAASNSAAVPAEESRTKAAAGYDEVAQAPAAAPAKSTTASSSSSLATQRAAAYPSDYRASWYTGLSDAALVAQLRDAEAAAKAAAAQGDYNAASAAVAPFATNADARVAQDFAGRAAEYTLRAGSASKALSLTRAARSRSNSNTPYLARLWAIEGAAQEALGDNEAAQRAYAEAARLNQSR